MLFAPLARFHRRRADSPDAHAVLCSPCRRFFEATTGGSVEEAPVGPLSERQRTIDLSGAGEWGVAQAPRPGKLDRLKRSASISVV